MIPIILPSKSLLSEYWGDTSHGNKEAEQIQPVQMNIYQGNIYGKGLSWLHFDDDPKAQETQQVKD